ncbi:unnamed protein product [Nippostrongylus brasiliensis]|uniref:Bromo domain-containing protein n=1 Tax=Nippostrongylus brasiliensis TaxID=27835 RepID=A0A0N4YBF7_NIPBR|nr:unnamed protein product [Nippostrongylus brasiliensis]
MTELNRTAVHRQLDELNAKITSARIGLKGTQNGYLKAGSGQCSMDDLRKKIFCCEGRINRNFLRPSFFIGDKKCLAYTMEMNGDQEKNGEDEDDRDEMEKDDEGVDESEREDSDNRQTIERWRVFVETVDTPAKLSFAVQMLSSSIAWELVPSLRLCQICRKRCEHSSTTLRCTACRLNYHTQCCKLFERRVIAHGESDDYVDSEEAADPSDHHHHHNHHNHHHHGSSNSHHLAQSRDAKKPQKRKADAPPPVVFPTDMNNDLCRAMLDELECQPGVGPFLEPVDLDLVPGYREAIANPIDMASIRNRIEAQCYETPDDFAADMELMFNNCRTFNEDDSPVGIAGATLHKFYHKRWRQLKYNFSKRLKRMRHPL